MGAQRSDFPGMPVGGVRFAVGVVAVIPQCDQSQLRHRGEDCRAGADDDLGLPAGDRQIVAVARRGAQIVAEHRVAALAEDCGHHGLQGLQCRGIRHQQQSAASAA